MKALPSNRLVALLGGLAATAVLLCGCSKDLGIEKLEFACSSDGDCRNGQVCLERDDGRKACMTAGATEDAADPTDAMDTDGADALDGADVDDCDCPAPGQNQRVECDGQDCAYSCEPGYANCDSDVPGCEHAIEHDTVDSCGACEPPVSCDFTDSEPNAIRACVQGQCVATCDAGWEDRDEVFENGCECGPDSDEAFATGRDINCDGVDGLASAAIFVAPDGDDGALGTDPDEPLATLDLALARANNEGQGAILLAEGEYVANDVSIDRPLSIYGGYDRDTWIASGQPSTIRSGDDEGPTLSIDRSSDRTTPARLVNLVIEGPSPNADGASSTAVHVAHVDAGGLTLVDTTVVGGVGAAGGAGDSGQSGNSGDNGSEGGDATAGYDTLVSGPSGADATVCAHSANSGAGGSGGDGLGCGHDSKGGDGAAGIDSGEALGGDNRIIS